MIDAKNNPPANSPRWLPWAVVPVLALLGLAAYANSFGVPMLLDDLMSIVDNESLRPPFRPWAVLNPPDTGFTVGRPLLNLTFAINYLLGGTEVGGYHAVNLLIHVAAAITLMGIVRRTLELPPWNNTYGRSAAAIGAIIAGLWLLHPVQTSSVTYISQRAESLMGLFYLLTLYGFIRAAAEGSSTFWPVASIIACVCGMGTKEVMVTAPVVVLLYDRAFVSESFGQALVRRRWYYSGLFSTWIFLAVLLVQLRWDVVAVGFQQRVSWWRYAMTEAQVVVSYLKLAFWPHPLVFDYGAEMLQEKLTTRVPYVAGILLLLVGTAWAWRRSKPVGFLLVTFFILLSPTSSVVPVAEQPMAENRMYLPLATIITLVVLGVSRWAKREALVGLGTVAVGLGVLTFVRNHDYRSAISIWEDSLAKRPLNSRGHNNFAALLNESPDRKAEAMGHFRESLRLKPDYAVAHNNFGTALAAEPGRRAEAIAHYEEALRLNPKYPGAYYNLAIELSREPGRQHEAIAHYETALRLQPSLPKAHHNLGTELAKLPGRQSEAIAHFEEAVRLAPTFVEARVNLGVQLGRIPGRSAEAIAHFQECLRIRPDYAEAHNNLANELSKLPDRQTEAVGHYEAALRLQPDSEATHYNLAVLLAKLPGRLPDAITHLETALRIRPDFVFAHLKIASIYAASGRVADAITHYQAVLELQPDFAEAHFKLGRAYADHGRRSDALRHVERALQLDPNLEGGSEYLAQLKAAQR